MRISLFNLDFLASQDTHGKWHIHEAHLKTSTPGGMDVQQLIPSKRLASRSFASADDAAKAFLDELFATGLVEMRERSTA
jgi:hypothetical protein